MSDKKTKDETGKLEEKQTAQSSREAFEQAGKVAFFDEEKRKIRHLHEELDRFFADDVTHEDWVELKRIAKFNFPDLLHAKYQDLNAQQKLFAIAECEGWSKSKFAEISGTARTTLIRWSKRADIILFQNDYKQAQGAGDPHREYSQQAHKALRFFNEILEWRPHSLEEKKLKFQVATYVTDRAHGPIGKMDFSGLDLKKLSEEIKKAQAPSKEEIKDLFEEK